jgi:mannosyltransferase OCH1-like enzyme
MITKIHQTSKTKNLNKFQRECSENAKIYHPKSEYTLWDDEDIKELAKKEFPDLLNVWDQLQGIQRADIGRYLILYAKGGAYADTDIVFNNNFFENMDFDENKIYFAPSVKIFPWNETTVTNYIIYAPKERMKFFKDLVEECIKRVREFKNTYSVEYVPYTTGREVVTEMFKKYKNTQIMDKTKVLDKFCDNTEITDNNVCYHEGSTIRNDEDGSWRSNGLMTLIKKECDMRENLGIQGNICQVPITIISIAIFVLVILCIAYKVWPKKR